VGVNFSKILGIATDKAVRTSVLAAINKFCQDLQVRFLTQPFHLLIQGRKINLNFNQYKAYIRLHHFRQETSTNFD